MSAVSENIFIMSLIDKYSHHIWFVCKTNTTLVDGRSKGNILLKIQKVEEEIEDLNWI